MPQNGKSPAANRLGEDLIIPSDSAEVHRLQKMIVDRLQALAYDEQDIFGIKLALEEALINAMKHGNCFDRRKSVHVSFHIDDMEFTVSIGDEGEGFNPSQVPDPTCEENLERPCGRGLMLMRHYMTDVRFIDNGHTVVMCKRRSLFQR